MIASVESVVENFHRNNRGKFSTSPAEPKPYLDEYLAEQGKLTFSDQIEKVSQIKIEARDRWTEDGGQKAKVGRIWMSLLTT